jgi:hypothetical protein
MCASQVIAAVSWTAAVTEKQQTYASKSKWCGGPFFSILAPV